MSIISAPHPTLRKVAKTVTKVDKKLLQNIELLKQSLQAEKNPEGVGLAFPQINKSIRGFAYQPNKKNKDILAIKVLFNPKILDHSQEQVLGKNPKEPDLEGCLSVPNLFAPVPRWSFVELEYQLIGDNQLVTYQQRFENYNARIVQHELDHLNGILFTDHVLKHKMPIYLLVDGELMPFDELDLLKTF